MTNEEIAVRIQAGETELLPVLWEQVERFVSQMAGKAAWAAGHVTSFDDLRQCGYLALVDAVKGYSEDKGKFLTWFGFFLKTAFAEEAGYRTQHQRRDPLRWSASLDAPIPGAEDLLLSDMVPDPADSIGDVEEAVWREELHTAMTEALCTLPPECRDMLHRLYYQGQTLTAAGRETGRTLEGARQVEKTALRQLRRPQTARKLRPFAYPDGDIYAAGLRSTGTGAFMRTGTSSTEAAVLRMESGLAL